MTIKAFIQWKEDYGLIHEPNYSKHTEIDCLNAFQAGQQYNREQLKSLLERYKQHTQLHTNDEFNRGWVSSFSCVVEDLEKLLK